MSFFDDLTSLVNDVTSIGSEFKQFTEDTVSEVTGAAEELTSLTDDIVAGSADKTEL